MIYCLKLIDMMMANAVFAKNTMKLYCIFLQCKNVQNFWSELKTNMQLILGIDLAIDPSTIILGNLLTKVNAIPLNTVYLAAKLYIFRKSNLNQIPNYSNFCNFLNSVIFFFLSVYCLVFLCFYL